MRVGGAAVKMKHTGVCDAQGERLSLDKTAPSRASIRPSELSSEYGSIKL